MAYLKIAIKCQMAVERYLLVDLAQQGFNPRLVIKKPIKNFFELIMIILGTCYEQHKNFLRN